MLAGGPSPPRPPTVRSVRHGSGAAPAVVTSVGRFAPGSVPTCGGHLGRFALGAVPHSADETNLRIETGRVARLTDEAIYSFGRRGTVRPASRGAPGKPATRHARAVRAGPGGAGPGSCRQRRKRPGPRRRSRAAAGGGGRATGSSDWPQSFRLGNVRLRTVRPRRGCAGLFPSPRELLVVLRPKYPSFRSVLRRHGAIRVAGAHEAIGGVLAQEAGFQAVWSSSFEISAARCLPDASVLTMTEYLEAAPTSRRRCGCRWSPTATPATATTSTWRTWSTSTRAPGSPRSAWRTSSTRR